MSRLEGMIMPSRFFFVRNCDIVAVLYVVRLARILLRSCLQLDYRGK